MTEVEAKKLVAVVLASFPSQAARVDRDRANGMVDAFVSLLDDLAYDEVNRALRVLLQTKTFMPSIAEIRAMVVELRHGPQKAGGDAWGSVLDMIRAKGSYRSPGVDFHFADEVTARAVAALGWRELCLSENAVADRARFIDLYDKLAGDARREQQSPLLAATNDARRELAAPKAEAARIVENLGRSMRLTEGNDLDDFGEMPS